MHLRVYRDEARSGHIELVGEGKRPWTIDLVVVVTVAMLVVSFGLALAVHLIR